MDSAVKAALSVVGAIITLAIVAVIVSKQSGTPQVLKAAGSTLATVINAAVSPQATAATNGNPALGSWSSPAGAQGAIGQGIGSLGAIIPDLTSGLAALGAH